MPANAIELKIEARKLTSEHFERAVSAFFDLIRSVADNMAGEGNAVRWIVEVEAGSAIVRARPESGASDSIDAICRGVSALAEGVTHIPPYFTNVSLRAARTIAAIQDSDGEFASFASIKNGSEPIEVTSAIIAAVDDGGGYFDRF